MTHSVAVYIYVDGLGWWTKPTATNPKVPIQANGTFTASVFSGGLDDRATIYCAALLGPGVTPPIALGTCSIPAGLQILAIDCVERFGKTIQFAGHTWAIKEAPLPVGPGGNLFSDDARDVWVDAQGLHLSVAYRNGSWWSTEVVLLTDVGYGTYWFTTETQVVDLDPNLTFGAFTWDSYCDETSVPNGPNREIDFEDSKWGKPGDPTTSQVVVQPFTGPGNLVRYTTPRLSPMPTLSRSFTWTRNEVEFAVYPSQVSPCNPMGVSAIHKSVYKHDPSAGRYVPTDGRERFRFNFWINTAGQPSNGQPAQVTISDFRFSPTPGVFAGGCGVNPKGRLAVLSGGVSLGNTLTVGVDDPTGIRQPGALALLALAAAADPAFPCGTLVPGWGMALGVGEFLVGLSPAPVVLPLGLWNGPGSPVPFALSIPVNAWLIGRGVYVQGALADPASTVNPGLTDALELCIRP